MASPILSYRPEIKILIAGVDYSKRLGDVGSVRLQKHLYGPAGEVHISFPDMPTAGRDSLYGIVMPMDRLEIMILRWEEYAATIMPWVHVLRGFVRSVGRQEQVGGDGRVQREVVIIGQDCGAPFIIQQLHPFISYQNSGVNKPFPYAWLEEHQLISGMFKISEFIWEIADKTTRGIMQRAQWEYIPVLEVKKGYALPYQSMSQQGSIWQELTYYADRPWNEVFVREGKDGPEFVFRPAPWRDINDNPLPDAQPGPFHQIPIRNVVSLVAHRDDAELVQHVWVKSPLADNGMAEFISAGRGMVNKDTRSGYGDRRVEILETVLGGSSDQTKNQKQPEHLDVLADLKRWIEYRLAWAVIAHAEIDLFERGQLTIKGNPKIQVGDYITVNRGEIVWDGYVVAVTHDFKPYHHYMTTVEYIRGNQWVRRKQITAPWDKERKQGTGI